MLGVKRHVVIVVICQFYKFHVSDKNVLPGLLWRIDECVGWGWLGSGPS